MSSIFTGVTFAQQRVTPSDDAQIHRAVLPDGILSGCELSYSGSTLIMAPGSLLICGRQIRHASTQNWAVSGATSGFARLLLTVDLSRTATDTAFEQVIDTIEYSSEEDGFPALEQADVNRDGTRYQIVVCVVSLGTGGITGIVSQLGITSVANAMAEISKRVIISKVWDNPDQTVIFKKQTAPLDLSKASWVCIEFRFNIKNSTRKKMAFGRIGANVILDAYSSSGNYFATRSALVAEDGITFTSTEYTADVDDPDAYIVPTAVYAISWNTVATNGAGAATGDNTGAGGSVSSEDIEAAVVAYMQENPTTPESIGAVSAEDLTEAVNDALTHAKESGVFNGKNGITPIKGVDYYTEADKDELVQLVLTELGGNPVYGYVDADNNVVVRGSLADGTYTVKYEMEDGSTVDIGNLVLGEEVHYSVTANLTNCTSNNSATQVSPGGGYSATITANSGYELSSVKVTMGGTDITSSAYSNGVIAIGSVTGNVVITASAVKEAAKTYTITNNLTNCANSNSVTVVEEGSAYNATITANDGYELDSVSVTMGGSAVTVTNGVINIASVTGDIVITAIANEKVNNLLLSATDANGNVITNGYEEGKRLGASDGGERTQSGCCMSGYMPVSAGKTVKIENITLSSGSYNYICFYDSSYTFKIAKTLGTDTVGTDGNHYIYTNDYSNYDTFAFFRFSCGTISADTVVTVLDGKVKP